MQTPMQSQRLEGDERRDEPRSTCMVWAQYLPLPATEPWMFRPAVITDCCSDGLSIECSEPLTIAEEMIVRIHLPEVQVLVFRICSVVRQNFFFRIGGQFVRSNTDPKAKDMQALISKLSA